nr:MAG TPA: hypothetical protein [Caudoviricetes sp.]
MIYWRGKSTDGIMKWNFEASSFADLFNLLMSKEIINDNDYDVYDRSVLEKYDKTEDDEEFKDDDGELDYNKVQAFVNQHHLTDEELWLLIASRDGNAYYQTFERGTEEGRIEIGQNDFEDGHYKY